MNMGVDPAGTRAGKEPRRFGQAEGGKDGLLPGGDRGTLRDAAVGGGPGDEVHPVELVADLAPGIRR